MTQRRYGRMNEKEHSVSLQIRNNPMQFGRVSLRSPGSLRSLKSLSVIQTILMILWKPCITETICRFSHRKASAVFAYGIPNYSSLSVMTR